MESGQPAAQCSEPRSQEKRTMRTGTQILLGPCKHYELCPTRVSSSSANPAPLLHLSSYSAGLLWMLSLRLFFLCPRWVSGQVSMKNRQLVINSGELWKLVALPSEGHGEGASSSVLGVGTKPGTYLEFSRLRECSRTDKRAECPKITTGAFS